MSDTIRFETFTYPSADGKSTVHAYLWVPETPRGIVQLSHGMCEYVQRYDAWARRFAEAGFIFAGNDHLGHGHTALDTSGNKTYDRDAFSAHGGQNFTGGRGNGGGRSGTSSGDQSWFFKWGDHIAKGYPNRKDPDHFTDVLHGPTGPNYQKGDGHGHMIIEEATGEVVMSREIGEDEPSMWDQDKAP